MMIIMLTLLYCHTIGLLDVTTNLIWSYSVMSSNPDGRVFQRVCSILSGSVSIDAYLGQLALFTELMLWQLPIVKIFWI